MATTLSSTSRGGHISGVVTMSSNGGSWNLRVGDVAPDGACVYGEIEPDVPNHTDPELHSSKACGDGTSIGWTGSYTRQKTRGLRVKICNDGPVPDECSEVAYIPTT
jgi:hypothetical protein